jgi:hypothetical protein
MSRKGYWTTLGRAPGFAGAEAFADCGPELALDVVYPGIEPPDFGEDLSPQRVRFWAELSDTDVLPYVLEPFADRAQLGNEDFA